MWYYSRQNLVPKFQLLNTEYISKQNVTVLENRPCYPDFTAPKISLGFANMYVECSETTRISERHEIHCKQTKAQT
jgi:hypothetical protein